MEVHKQYVTHVRGGGTMPWTQFEQLYAGAYKKQSSSAMENSGKRALQAKQREERNLKKKLPVPDNQRCSICTELLNFTYVTNHCRSIAERVEYVPDGPPVPNDCEQNLAKKREGVTTPCKHCFHRCCLGKWLQITNSCPICKTAFTQEFKERVTRIIAPQPQQLIDLPAEQYRFNYYPEYAAALSYVSGIADVNTTVVTIPSQYSRFVELSLRKEFANIINYSIDHDDNNDTVRKVFEWIKGYRWITPNFEIIYAKMFELDSNLTIIFLNLVFTYVKQNGTIIKPSTYFQNSFVEAFIQTSLATEEFIQYQFDSLKSQFGYNNEDFEIESAYNIIEKTEISQIKLNDLNESTERIINNTDFYNLNANIAGTRTLHLQMLQEVLYRLENEESEQAFVKTVKSMCLCAYKSKTMTFEFLSIAFSYWVNPSRGYLYIISQAMYNLGEYFATGGQL